MAINSSLRQILRVYINDLDSTDWTDSQLDLFITVAAGEALSDLTEWETEIGGPYTLDFTTPDITPDPVSQTSAPVGFINLIVLRAAVVLSRADLKKKSATMGFKIKDDRSEIDTRGLLETSQSVLDSYIDNYNKFLEQWRLGNRAVPEGILSPIGGVFFEGMSSRDDRSYYSW